MELTREEIEAGVRSLGRWFHNIELDGVPTAPEHALGNYPNTHFRHFAHTIPSDLSGKTVLDIGCNAGFYSIEMKRRGAARVVGIDSDERCVEQARFAARVSSTDIEVHRMDVYDVASLRQRFDLVLFLGVFDHVRYPLLALDLLRAHVVRDVMLFQAMLRGGTEVGDLLPDYPFEERRVFDRSDYPKLHFVEERFAGDPGSRWIPNRACVEAMLRAAGFDVIGHPEDEVYVCRASGLVDARTTPVASPMRLPRQEG